MSIDNLIDEAIDKVIAESGKTDDELKKRKPKQPSFRYLTNDEIKEELEKADMENVSIMKSADKANIVADDVFKLGIGGDIHTVEEIIKRHQTSRKFR
jgi:hypothetical protein